MTKKRYYRNEHKMRKARKIKVIQTNGKCEVCSKKGRHIHHKDKTKYNHRISNLIFVCVLCHKKLHKCHEKDYILSGYWEEDLRVISKKLKIGYSTVKKYFRVKLPSENKKKQLIDEYIILRNCKYSLTDKDFFD